MSNGQSGSRLNTSTARDGSALSNQKVLRGDGGEELSSWNKTGEHLTGGAQNWGRETRGRMARDARTKHALGDRGRAGREETARSRARREEEEERVWKEAHKRQLESELAGDLEKEWREIAAQRKLRAEVSRLAKGSTTVFR